MTTQPKTLADLAVEAADIERQQAAIQLPVLQDVQTALSKPAVASLVATLEAARASVLGPHAEQLGYLITTLTNVPTYVAQAVQDLGQLLNPAPAAPPEA